MGEDNNIELRKKICVHLCVCLLVILVLVFVVPKIIGFFAPLILAWILAMMANPLVRFLEKKIKIMRKHGSVIVIVVVLLAISMIIYGLASLLFSQLSSLIVELPDLYEEVVGNIQHAFESLHAKYNMIPPNFRELINIDDGNQSLYYVMAEFTSEQSFVHGRFCGKLAD